MKEPCKDLFIFNICSSESEVLIIGGHDGSSFLSTAEIYSIASGLVRELPSMPTPRYSIH